MCLGDALDGESHRAVIPDCDTFIHLVGVPHPSPAKAREFVAVDLRSAQEAIRVAALAGIRHFISLSVAQPAPVVKAYLRVRAECEAWLRASGMNATVVRPWYVLGPGHHWPVLLKPLYRVAELTPSTREGALRLGLVNRALAAAMDEPVSGTRILEVPEIRRSGHGRGTERLPHQVLT